MLILQILLVPALVVVLLSVVFVVGLTGAASAHHDNLGDA